MLSLLALLAFFGGGSGLLLFAALGRLGGSSGGLATLATFATLGHVLDGLGAGTLVHHSGEALVIGEVLTSGEAGHLLGGSGRIPFVLHVSGLPCLLDGASAGATVDGKCELGQSEAAERVDDTGEVHTVNENSSVVHEVNNDAQLAVVGAIVNVGHAASLNVSSEHLKSQGVKMSFSSIIWVRTKRTGHHALQQKHCQYNNFLSRLMSSILYF